MRINCTKENGEGGEGGESQRESQREKGRGEQKEGHIVRERKTK